jgi:hypothetical protein
MSNTPATTQRLAPPGLRDQFLTALDQQDYIALEAVRTYLTDCANILPSTTCILLGLKPGSTYSAGAEAAGQVIALARVEALNQKDAIAL